MTILQTILAKHFNEPINKTLVDTIRKEVSDKVGHGISREYFHRATLSTGILSPKNIQKAISDAYHNEGSFSSTTLSVGLARYKKTRFYEDD